MSNLWIGYAEAINLHQQGKFAAAEQKYQQVLAQEQNNSYIWHNLGTLYYEMKQYEKALNILTHCLQLNKSQYLSYYTLGLILEKTNQLHAAISAYQQTIALHPQFISAYTNLGRIFTDVGNLDEAIGCYQKALGLKNNDPDLLYGLGNAFAQKGKDYEIQASFYLGFSFYRKGKYKLAIQQYQKFLAISDKKLHISNIKRVYIFLLKCFQELNQAEGQIEVYQKLKTLSEQEGELTWIYEELMVNLHRCGRTTEAIAIATEAAQLFPNQLFFKRQKHLLVPIIYDSPEEICYYRHRFTRGLANLIAEIPITSKDLKILEAIGICTNFYLQYQGRNDRDLQMQYGQFIHRIMTANYPEFTQILPIPPWTEDGRIRVGYISAYMKIHSVAKTSLGWIKYCDRQKFQVYCYHLGQNYDGVTAQFQAHSDIFRHLPHGGDLNPTFIQNVGKQIIADRLHILVFLDIGMQPYMTLFAGLRLAPLQCATWGHPVTSGFPTIDYFLSGDLMEIETAASHYSEKLVRLPKIGIPFAKPPVPLVPKSRADFQLQDDRIIYLTCQSLFKYLPQYDYILPEIAKRVPQAQFIFIRQKNAFHVINKFWQRLQISFAVYGLNIDDYCTIVSQLHLDDYLHLNLVADVFLDTFEWSGCNSTFEAIACNLPVVTCPGEFMRGRHSYAILQMLGVTDTIAKDETEYIEIAVKLGLDQAWREQIVKRISQRHQYVYDEQTCVTALEQFYESIVV